MLALTPGTCRFNALRREVEGITQKMLGQTLRKLERNGLIHREAFKTMPMTVQYTLTGMGRTLLHPDAQHLLNRVHVQRPKDVSVGRVARGPLKPRKAQRLP